MIQCNLFLFLLTFVIPFKWTTTLSLFHKSKNQRLEKGAMRRRWRGAGEQEDRGPGEENERGPGVGVEGS
jgi:hypothetical protein